MERFIKEEFVKKTRRIKMKFKTILTGLIVAGAASLCIPEVRSRISPYVPSFKTVVKSVEQVAGLEDNVNKPGSNTQDYLTRPDGTKMEPWNYRGNEWPKEWAIQNPDGSYNRDYIRWYEREHRRR